jgi:MoaA/NifB/PqqE/SkfB family radical SAM enzyme
MWRKIWSKIAYSPSVYTENDMEIPPPASVTTYDFANILFGGTCNRFCPWCIGKKLPSNVTVNNLGKFPLTNLDGYVDAVNTHRIKQVVFTGTTTDPQLYKHEILLLNYLRIKLNHDACYSLHTNGVLALIKLDAFNHYDKVCISFPSFNRETYKKLMGVPAVPQLATIIEKSKVPIKISCIVSEHNHHEMEGFLTRCAQLGIRRVVLRKLVGDTRDWNPFRKITPITYYKQNPVYTYKAMEVTYWDFDSSSSSSINLFPDGTLGKEYLLTETAEFKAA